MPWEEPGESWQVPAESDPPPRLPGEAARGKPSPAGPSERRAHTARRRRGGAPAGRGQGRRRGRCRGPLPAQPLASPEEVRARAAAAASVALANSRGARSDSARRAASFRLGARGRLSAAGSAAQCPARRPQLAAVASCPVRPEGGGPPAPSRGSATGSAPAPRLQPPALRRRHTPRPAPRGREAGLWP